MTRWALLSEAWLDANKALTLVKQVVFGSVDCRIGFIDEASLQDHFSNFVVELDARKSAVSLLRIVFKVLDSHFFDYRACRGNQRLLVLRIWTALLQLRLRVVIKDEVEL